MPDFGKFALVSGRAAALIDPVMSARGPAKALAAGIEGRPGAATGWGNGPSGSFGLATGGTTSNALAVGTLVRGRGGIGGSGIWPGLRCRGVTAATAVSPISHWAGVVAGFGRVARARAP